jgi:hypothetical protein
MDITYDDMRDVNPHIPPRMANAVEDGTAPQKRLVSVSGAPPVQTFAAQMQNPAAALPPSPTTAATAAASMPAAPVAGLAAPPIVVLSQPAPPVLMPSSLAAAGAGSGGASAAPAGAVTVDLGAMRGSDNFQRLVNAIVPALHEYTQREAGLAVGAALSQAEEARARLREVTVQRDELEEFSRKQETYGRQLRELLDAREQELQRVAKELEATRSQVESLRKVRGPLCDARATIMC